MSSVLITVELEVEVFYIRTEDGFEAETAICDGQVPRPVSKWAEEQAIRQFEEMPCKALQYTP